MKCYVAIGANIGKPLANLTRAVLALSQTDGISIRKISPLYKTEAVGPSQPDFLNGVLVIDSTLPASELLASFLEIEKLLGRVRREKWGPRSIDIDLLTFGTQLIRRRNLIIPHPRYHRRRFVLTPLCDIAPNARHPKLNSTHRALLAKLTPLGQRVTIAASWNGKQFSPFKRKNNKSNRSSR